jgi:hypothetical protein
MSKAAELAALIGGQSSLAMPNMIINGDCRVAQRGTSLASITSGNNFQVDRWNFQPSGHGTWTLSQNSTTGLSGFETSTKMLCTSNGGTPAAADFVILFYNIEGHDTQKLKFGQSDAERFTVSWYVKSNKTGTGIIEAQTTESTASATVETSKTYTISQANTWEFKSVTFPANTDHAQATANKTTSTGLSLRWVLDTGTNLTSGTAQTTWANQTTANRWVGQNLGIGRADDDYMELTGLQIDVGDVAQPFKYETFAENLARCQRYFYLFGRFQMSGYQSGTTSAIGTIYTPVRMRADPSISFSVYSGYSDNTTSIATQGAAHTNRTMTGQTAERKPGTAIEFTIQCSGGFGGSDNRPLNLFNFFGDFLFDAEL